MDGRYPARRSGGSAKRSAVSAGISGSGRRGWTLGRLSGLVFGFLLTVFVLGCGADGDVSEPPVSRTTATLRESTTSTTQPPTTVAEGEEQPLTTAPTSAAVPTLETLTQGIELPWQWGNWTVDEFGYPSHFSVRYDGDHLFGIYPFGESVALIEESKPTLEEAAIRADLRERLNGAESFSHTLEPAEFFGHPALLSVWISPAEGPAEDVFVELYWRFGFQRGVMVASWSQFGFPA